MIKKTAFFALSILFTVSCSTESVPHAEILSKNIRLDVHRFEIDFSPSSGKNLNDLKKEYPFFFPVQTPDSIWMAKRNDSIEKELFVAVDSVFPSFDQALNELNKLFKYRDYYQPNAHLPKVYTLTTDVDFAHRIIFTDSLLLIGLDNYLGANHRFYQAFPDYISSNLKKEYLVADVAEAIAQSWVPHTENRYFLSQMIHEGKILYIKSLLIPELADAALLQYSEEQMEWAQLNEAQIWRYFVEEELLYSSDKNLAFRFIFPAPFSKFQLEIDAESPGRLGRYIGYKMVKSYVEKTQCTLDELLAVEAIELLKKSNYKPEK